MILDIKGLKASVNGQQILKGINLQVKAGEVHAIMGPNGSGKSTLSKVVAGHPSFEVDEGSLYYSVNLKMTDLTKLAPDVRAKEGIFLAFQYPVEIPGVSNFEFLKTSFNSLAEHQGFATMDDKSFRDFLTNKLELVKMEPSFLDRPVNTGFSGGEKKRNEILQMAVLSPQLAFLDETDSGLDIDALKVVAGGVNKLRTNENAVVLVTHYQRLLDHIEPDYVHVLAKGKIVETGGKELALELEKKGYDWLTT